MMICFFGICVPVSTLLPLLFLVFKPIATFLGLWPFIESFMHKKNPNVDKYKENAFKSEEQVLQFKGETLKDETLWCGIIGGDDHILVRY